MDNVSVVSLGGDFSATVTEEGSLYTWGSNGWGRLGYKTNGSQYTPGLVTIPITESTSENISVTLEEIVPITTPTAPQNTEAEYTTATEEVVPTIRQDTNNASYLVAEATGLLPNECYNFYILKSQTAENLLSSNNLLYIGQTRTDASGNLSITYQQKAAYENPVYLLRGMTRTDIAGAQATVSDLAYTGEEQYPQVTVTYQGTTLTEGEDYELTGSYSATDIGEYTVNVRGIKNYTGVLPVTYQVICHHKESGDWITEKEATCSEAGSRTKKCKLCNEVTATEAIAKTEHSYTTTINQATTKKNGSQVQVCSGCGDTITTTIYYPKTIELSKTGYTYNGKEQKPSVTVKDSKGNALKENTDYTISYPKDCKSVGKYTVTIQFKGNYSGTVKKTVTIQPKGTSLSKLAVKGSGIQVKWKKQNTQTSGYQLQYATNSSFKKGKAVLVKNAKTTKQTITKLKKGQIYYVRIRTYKTVKVDGTSTRLYSTWSKAEKITLKPEGTSITKVTAKSKAIQVSWKKQSSQTSGYQIQYATKKNFKGGKAKLVKSNKTTKQTISGLKGKKTYYVRVRTYKTIKVNGKSTRLYSAWSKAKKVKTKE